ncbi:signal peptidase II [Granulicella cerasi]|uniref:Lipoprotein signal peptidase n=1 Tax=Granulicella cerasi TaxID=741063 RepID=A0ABW1Z4X7_9BACT|nr:signal peptidase II [Granulicella cerasi]
MAAVRGSLRDARWICFLLAIVVIVVDRWSKLWVVAHIKAGSAITIIPHVFRLTHVLNFGAAFSMFAESTSPNVVRNMLIAFSTLACLVVLVLILRWGKRFSLTSFSLALILGGAIGNLYDRIRLQHVVDFLEVHIGSYHWPDFNIADSAIVVGACLLLLEAFLPQKNSR